MPARSATAPRRIPLHLPVLARSRGAPHCEVSGIPLALGHLDPHSCLLAGQVEPGERAVAADFGRVEVQAGWQPVAPATGFEDLGEPDHLRDVISRFAPDVGLDDPQSAEIGLELPGVALGDLPGVPVLAARRDFQLVVALVASEVRWPTSVMLMTWRTRQPFQLSTRLSVSAKT